MHLEPGDATPPGPEWLLVGQFADDGVAILRHGTEPTRFIVRQPGHDSDEYDMADIAEWGRPQGTLTTRRLVHPDLIGRPATITTGWSLSGQPFRVRFAASESGEDDTWAETFALWHPGIFIAAATGLYESVKLVPLTSA